MNPCVIAAVYARRNCRRIRIVVIDTMLLVMLVPMLAPMTAKTAVSSVIWPAPTRPTMIAVVNDELCTIAVAMTPPSRAMTGLSLARRFRSRSELSPNSFRPPPMTFIAQRNR